MLQKSDSAWNEVLRREPWPDNTELCSSVGDIVLGESQYMNLEDFGTTKKEVVKTRVLESVCIEDLSSFSTFVVLHGWILRR